MTIRGPAVVAPDPSWTASELLDRAEDCTSLSAAWLPALGALDPRGLEPDQKLTLALVLHRMVSVTEALALAALAEVPYRSCVPDPALALSRPEAAARVCPGGKRCPHGWQIDEFCALTGLPRWLMGRRWGWSYALRDEWAGLQPLLAGQQLNTEHLRQFERATCGATEEATAATVTAAVAHIAANPGVSAESFGRSARRSIERNTSPAETRERRRHRAADDVGVTYDDLGDGIAALTLVGDTRKLEAIRNLVRDDPSITTANPEDTRTRGNARSISSSPSASATSYMSAPRDAGPFRPIRPARPSQRSG